MQFPQSNATKIHVRSISTSNIDELAHFQINKNRRYTQLHRGVLSSSYSEVNLGGVQIFRESLTAGARIEAAPAPTFLPFGVIFQASGIVKYCGKQPQENSLIQATGGDWDVCFNNKLDYVCAAFNRDTFNNDIKHLTGREIPLEWLVSKACKTNPGALNGYKKGISTIIQKVLDQPELLKNPSAQQVLSAELLKLAFHALMPTIQYTEQLKPQAYRIRGVRRVIDYLQVHAAQLPSIPELCKIAELSERSLEYGFREYLGVTPIRYLSLVRLNGARRDLLAATPKRQTVANIALNWGFLELGRFSGVYRQLFEELPSDTLRSNTR